MTILAVSGWAIGGGILLAYALGSIFVLALCRAAGNADRAAERMRYRAMGFDGEKLEGIEHELDYAERNPDLRTSQTVRDEYGAMLDAAVI